MRENGTRKIYKENPSVERTLAKRAHVWVTLGKGENEVKVKALIDTGNTIR